MVVIIEPSEKKKENIIFTLITENIVQHLHV